MQLEVCKVPHTPVLEEWTLAYHQVASTDVVFTQFYDRAYVASINCH